MTDLEESSEELIERLKIELDDARRANVQVLVWMRIFITLYFSICLLL